jgi:hypothetical protein
VYGYLGASGIERVKRVWSFVSFPPPSVLFFFIAFSFLTHFVLLAIPLLLLFVLLSLAALFFGLGKANIMKLLPLSKQFLFIVECLFVQ